MTDIKNLDYEELVTLHEQLTKELENISDNRKIYSGTSEFEELEQKIKESILEIEKYKNEILLNEQELVLLRQQYDTLLKEKEELNKKNFFVRTFTKNNLNDKLTFLRQKIEDTENFINSLKERITRIENNIKKDTDSFLSRFALNGMTLEDYKTKLNTIMQNTDKFTDYTFYTSLKDKINDVEDQIKFLKEHPKPPIAENLNEQNSFITPAVKLYLENHLNDKYNITIEDKEYSINIKDIIHFVTLKDEIYYYEQMYNYNTNLLYAAVTFMRENFSVEELGKEVNERLSDIENDPRIKLVNTVYKTNDKNFSKIIVSDELTEAVLDGIDECHNFSLYKAIYIYIKLCQILTYDEEFFAMNQQGKIADMHENIEHIKKITPQNNKVVCYEFAAIYESLLDSIGIPAELVKYSDDYNKYGGEHTSVRFKADGHIVNADSTTSILGGDLFSTKIHAPLLGLYSRNEYNSNLWKSIEYVYNEIIDRTGACRKYNTDLYTYDKISNPSEPSLEEKIKVLIAKVNSSNLKGVDCLALITHLKHIIFTKDELENNIDISFIRNNINDNSEVSATVKTVFVIRNKNGDNIEQYNYYLYSPSEKLEPITQEELIEMYNNKILENIEGDHHVRGVR